MRARRGDTARRARVCSYLWLSSTAAALLVLLAVLFTSPGNPAGDDDGRAATTAHVLDVRLHIGTATPLRPDVSARTMFTRSQPVLRRVWQTRADAGFEMVLPAHHASREKHAAAATTFLLHSHDFLKRRTGSLSSHTTSLPPPSAG